MYDDESYTWFQPKCQVKARAKTRKERATRAIMPMPLQMPQRTLPVPVLRQPPTFFGSSNLGPATQLRHAMNHQSFKSEETSESCLPHALKSTSMVLDIGCTSAVTSRPGAKDFMAYVDHHPGSGLWYELRPTNSHFSFANSEMRKKIATFHVNDLSPTPFSPQSLTSWNRAPFGLYDSHHPGMGPLNVE